MDRKNITRRGFILKLGKVAGAVSTGLFTHQLFAATTGKVTGARLSGDSNQLTFSLLLDKAVDYKVFKLKQPERIVIDLQQTKLDGKLKQGQHNRPPMTALRYAVRSGDDLRVVLDMAQPVAIQSSLNAINGGHELNIVINPKAGTSPVSPAPAAAVAKPAKPQRAVTSRPKRGRKFTVVIDPGHGGRDPGAVGRRGTREKDVVLSVARKLKARIDRQGDMRAVLTRDKDAFLPLRKRIELAHQHKADLFISVHADANNNKNISGSSVYILSQNGASSEAAKLLAESENSYDLKFGNVSLSDANSRIASVLLDLSQSATIDRSLDFAKGVLNELAKVNNPLRRRVESAGFMVLKSPDIPSMLVETAFISNPTEERRLRTDHYQNKLADALFRGVKRYKTVYGAQPEAVA